MLQKENLLPEQIQVAVDSPFHFDFSIVFACRCFMSFLFSSSLCMIAPVSFLHFRTCFMWSGNALAEKIEEPVAPDSVSSLFLVHMLP